MDLKTKQYHMEHQFAWHVAIAVAIGAALAFLLVIQLRTQIPVDIRGAAPPQRLQPGPLRLMAPSDELANSLIATRYVIDDLLAGASSLKEQAYYLEDDADFYWSNWKNFVGLRGSTDDWMWPSNKADGRELNTRAEHVQSLLFGLNSAAKSIKDDVMRLQLRVAAAEADWSILRNGALRARQEDGGTALLKNKLETLQDTLSGVSVQLSSLDRQISIQQAQMDDLYPRASAFLSEYLKQEYVTDAIRRRKPWHWNYMLSDTPRPVLQYNFKERYLQYLEHGRSQIQHSFGAPALRLH